MASFLVFKISAALGSMGGYAGNQRRGTENWPARSAINGLLGAALGIDRGNKPAIDDLELGYASGVVKLKLGPILSDFHTTQSIPGRVARVPNSRREALDAGARVDGLQTILSERDYHEECEFNVVVCAYENARWPLKQLQKSLLFPKFVLYLGRKACPLIKPLNPKIYNSNSAADALNSYWNIERVSRANDEQRLWRARFDPALLETVPDDAIRIRRRDKVVDRERWLFSNQDCLEFNLKMESQK